MDWKYRGRSIIGGQLHSRTHVPIEFSEEQLLRIRNIVSTLFLTESHYNLDLLVAELLAVFEKEADRQAASLLLNWFRQLREYGRIDPNDYHTLETTYSSVEEARTMLITALEKEREQIREEGREEGIEQGQKRERVAMITQILNHNFETVPEEVGVKLSLCTLQQLQPLINHALTAPDLDTFVTKIPEPDGEKDAVAVDVTEGQNPNQADDSD